MAPTCCALERRFSAAEQAVIDDINRRIAEVNSIVELVDFVFARVETCLPCDRIGVAFVEEQGRRLASYYAVARYPTLWLGKGFVQDLAGSSLEAVIRDGRPRILNDLPAYLRTHPESQSTALIAREGIQASLTCPLIVDQRPIGVLFFSSLQANVYREQHVALQQAIAERLSQAAEKAYRLEQLEAANRAYQEILGFVAHELKNPVASMVTNADLILDGYLGEVSEAQRPKLQRISDRGRYLIGFIENYLNLSRIEQSEQAPVLVAIPDLAAEVIEPALELLHDQIAQKPMTLEADLGDAAIPVLGDAELLRILTVNLVGNAVKYGREGGRIQVLLRLGEDEATLSVWNEGPGFPPEKRGSLFKRFSRQNSGDLIRQRGTGLGLYICWKIIQLHQGRIWADAELGAWARFTFRLPLGHLPPGQTVHAEPAAADTAAIPRGAA